MWRARPLVTHDPFSDLVYSVLLEVKDSRPAPYYCQSKQERDLIRRVVFSPVPTFLRGRLLAEITLSSIEALRQNQKIVVAAVTMPNQMDELNQEYMEGYGNENSEMKAVSFNGPSAAKTAVTVASRDSLQRASYCSKAFKRSEHCLRHERAHTQEKPFVCQFCRRRYSRKDLLTRHEKTIHAAEQIGPVNRPSIDKPPGLHEIRVRPDPGVQFVINDNPVHFNQSADWRSEQAQMGNNHPQKPVNLVATTVDDSRRLPDLRTVGHQLRRTSNATTDLNENDHEEHQRNLPSSQAATQPPSTTCGIGPSLEPYPDVMDECGNLDLFDPFLDLSPSAAEATLLGFACDFSPLGEDTEFSTFGPQSALLDVYVDPDNNAQQGPHTQKAADQAHSTTDSTRSQVSSLTPIDKSGPVKSPVPHLSPSAYSRVLLDLANRLSPHDLSSLSIPNMISMRKCLKTYVEVFHIHFPILHLPTLNLDSVPVSLILIMCSIGALYRLERRVSSILYVAAELLATAVEPHSKDISERVRSVADWRRPRPAPTAYDNALAASQTRLLIAYQAAFNGNPEVFQSVLSIFSKVLLDYRQRISDLDAQPSSTKMHEWREWTQRETSKRLVYGCLILSNLLTMTYGMYPCLSVARDGEIELPDDQRMWDATTEEDWQRRRSLRGEATLPTMRQYVFRLFSEENTGNDTNPASTFSPFSCLVTICAVSIQVWYTVSGYDFARKADQYDLFQMDIRPQIEFALSRCRALITESMDDSDYTLSEAEHPLLFNCVALLRVCYCRTFTLVGYSSRLVLLEEDEGRIVEILVRFISTPDSRDKFTSLAVRRAFEGMLIPSKAGALLVRKTAALTWAVEHALAGWDSALLVSKWVHSMEKHFQQDCPVQRDDSGNETFDIIRQFLTGSEVDDESPSLAARLCRHWASFYDDTWVWGVTPRIGWILRRLATCYEEALPE